MYLVLFLLVSECSECCNSFYLVIFTHIYLMIYIYEFGIVYFIYTPQRILFSQVHPTKKANKFECKLCGEKQSIKRHYGLGTAKECRVHVQKLNGIRGEIDELTKTTKESDNDFENQPVLQPNIENFRPKKSKWTDFAEKSQDTTTADPDPNKSMFLNNIGVLEVPRKIRNLGNRSINFRCPSISKPSKSNNSEDNIHNERESSAKLERDSYGPKASLLLSSQLHETNDYAKFIKSNEIIPIKIESTKKQMNERDNKKFVTPLVNNSKWTQFVETEVESEGGDHFNDTNETIKDENYDYFIGNDNSTEDSEHYANEYENEKCAIHMNNTKTKLIQKHEVKTNKGLINMDKYGNKDTCESTKNIDDNIGNSIMTNTLFALCEDSDLDEILDI